MSKLYTPSEIIDELKSRQGVRAQTDFAEEIGITQGTLNKVLSGKLGPGEKVLQYLELEEVGPMYRRKAR